MQRTECDGPDCHNPPAVRSKYCSAACRNRRSRYNLRARASGRSPGELVSDEAERATQELLREELRPHVREAITDEVIEQIKALIGHLPLAIEELAAQLHSDDEEIRHKAAKLLLQHSAGNKSIVPDINADKQQALIVHFALPRPEVAQPGEIEGDTTETRQCDSCQAWKPHDQFEGGSDRCIECFERFQKIGQGIVERTARG